MNEDISIVRVPTGLIVSEAMQDAQDRLLSRFGDALRAKNVQAVVNNPKTALIFAIVGAAPVSDDDWQNLSPDSYIGTITLMMLQTTAHNVAHIDEIVVEPGHEGQGIGKRLMQKAIEVAHENDTSRFDLTSRPEKAAANALYEKMGFKKRDTNVWRLED